jgi:hypothetical protein
MNTLYDWAVKWQVPAAALYDLQARMGLMRVDDAPEELAGKSESWVQAEVRMEASRKGMRVFRNNVGALQDPTGRWLRFGLANDSKALNQQMKSGDLIGIRPITILPAHVGHKFGLFCSYEIKAPGWTYSNTPHELAQANWAHIITSMGGDARFISQPGVL